MLKGKALKSKVGEKKKGHRCINVTVLLLPGVKGEERGGVDEWQASSRPLLLSRQPLHSITKGGRGVNLGQ